ncbi:hypothetical protein BT67DRAFT_448094 [Trichocladium antarcticum]|uniref:Peptide hydrolase n=1 Tax=Trichocladium antarcticum TaxID=1450529 RepID=A0AAN6UQ43_9PEZI|nr:hypothetical protein BT67DRAFT_448094 [Trichocladium antarcticum]
MKPRFLLLFALLPPSLAYTPLSDASLLHHIPPFPLPDTHKEPHQSPASRDPDFDPVHSRLLSPLLVPRVPGTPAHAQVQHHLASFVRTQLHPSWTLEWHNTTATTPATGPDVRVPFANLILRRDPPWTTTTRGRGSGSGSGDVARLTLAAHYDSLYRPEGFVGAVDSAVPCAVLMAVARAVDAALTRRWEGRAEVVGDGLEDDGEEEEKGVQILWLDGEEAWVEWSEADSLYGSRALAETWEYTRYEAGSTFSTPLEAISLFVLLDLLGAPEPNVPSYFLKTHWAYQKMATIEARLRALGVLEAKTRKPFLPESNKEARQFYGRGYVADDHVPFMRRGVDILHLIPSPFPSVWHTMDDDGAHLDVPTIRDWTRIVTAFVAEWMDLEGCFTEGETGKAEKKSEKDEL